MCYMCLAENTGRKNSPSAHHCTVLLGYILSTKAYIENQKKIVKHQYISSTCPHNMVNFSPLAAEINWWVWGTPANFNVFRVLASLLHRRHWTEVSQTLHDVWPSIGPGLVHYTYIFGGSCPLKEFCQVQNSLYVQVLLSPILAALLHGTREVGVSQTLWCGIFTRQGGRPIRQWVVELFSCSINLSYTVVRVISLTVLVW